VLFGQDGADEADQGVTAGEDPHDVGAAPHKPDGTLRGAVPIRVVRHRADLYVRSCKGGGAAWYRGTQATHAGHIESGGVGKDVAVADETDPCLGDALDAACRSKYRNYSPSIVDPMLTEQARGAKRRTGPRVLAWR
jgi:hypothetical protein